MITATGTIVVVCFCRCCHSLVQVMVSADISCVTFLMFYSADGSESWAAVHHGENHSPGLDSTGGAPEPMESLLGDME